MSDYSDLFEDPKPNPSLAVRLNADANPAQEAEYLKLAKRYSVPVPVIRSAPDDYKARAKAEDVDLFTEKAPVLRSWLSDSDKARLAATDAKSLAAVEKAFDRTVMGTLGDAGVTALKAAVALPESFVGLANIPTFGYAGKLVEQSGIKFRETQEILDSLYSPAQQQANLVVQEAEGFVSTAAAALQNPSTIVNTTVESVPQMLAGGFWGKQFLKYAPKAAPWLAAALGEGVMGAGSAAEQIRQQTDDGLLSVKQSVAATMSGAGTALFGAVGGKVSSKLGLADIDTALVRNGLDQATASAAKQGFISSIAKAGISEGLFEELPQSVQETMWQNWATDKPLGQGVGKAAAMGLLAGLATGGVVQGTRNVLERQMDTTSAEQHAQRLQEQMAAAMQATLREQSPEEFRSLVQSMAEGTNGAPSEVYIDAGVLNQLAPELLAQMPASVQEQLAAQVTEDTLISVPVGDVLTVAPGTPLEQFFIENARVAGPNSMSLAEAKDASAKAQEFLQQEAKRVIDQAQDQRAMQESSDRVKQGVLDQLNAAGRFRAQVNEAYATWTTAFYTTMAGRLGITPEQMAERYPLRITAQSGQGETLKAGKVGEIAVEGFHFSNEPRPQIDTAMFGTGLQGNNRDQYLNAADDRLRRRAYFYVDKGTGINPEAGVGGIAQKAQLTNVYDADADPLRLKKGGQLAFESAVLDAGFSGYLTRMEGTQSGQVIMLGEQTIPTEAIGPATKLQGQVVPAPQARESKGRDAIVDALNAAKGLPSGSPTRARWSEILQAQLPEVHAALEAAGIFAGNANENLYKSDLVKAFEAATPAESYAQRAERPVPAAVSDAADVSNARVIAASRQWPSNRDFKMAIQAAVRAVTGTRDLRQDTPENRAYITRQMLKEAREAIITNANAIGWYDEKVTIALAVASVVHPELSTDEQARFAFTWALAVTSNGVKVDKNFEMANRAYGQWKASDADPAKRTMPTSGIGIGPTASKIHEALATYNNLSARWGYDKFKAFATTLQPNRQVKADFGRGVSGEGMDTMVYGAGVVGPKIGNGFFMNLYGEFGQLTMDRWWVRMWGRITGDLVEVDRDKIKASRDSFVSLIEMIKEDKAATRAVEQAIGTRLGKGNPVEMAKAIIKATSAENVRRALDDVLPATPEREAAAASARGKLKDFVSIGDELRKAAKAYYGNLDGQIEVPGGSRRRDMMRAVSQDVLTELQKDHPSLTMADFQALMWYPEKTLYDAAGAQEQDAEGYNDEEAPDYANAAVALARQQGISDDEINAAIERARSDIEARRLARGSGRATAGVQSPGGDGVGGNSGAGTSNQTGEVNGQLEQAGDRGGRSPGAGPAPLPGAPVIEGATGPDPRLASVAEQYARDNGINLKRQAEYVTVDPERAARIAAAYEAMQHNPQDPAVREAYDNLIRQTLAQYRALEAAGYKFWFIDPTNDPYKSPWDAMRDLRSTQTMGVFPTVAGFGSGATEVDVSDNPLMADTGITWAYGSPDGELKPVLANDLFRAVHDAFGHGLEGAGFRAQGEENAWQAHIRLFTGSAQGAITSETRGQNSWLNFGPHGATNQTAKVEDTVFADQKTGLMPEWTWSEGLVGDMAEQGVLEQRVEFPRIEDFQGLKLRRSSADIRVSAASAFADGPFTIQPGVREIPLTEVTLQDSAFLRSEPEQKRIAALAEQIKKNGSIEPLFVAQRADGSRYVAEGQHRAYALRQLGYTSVPARVMVEQGGELQQGPRGTFNPGTLELALNENADLSTFLHETGHFFLEVMADLATQPGAPADIQQDMAALMKWFGVADLATWNDYSLDEKRPYHERFAESFEQYLLEGKAPSPELQPLFRKFRAWMLNVYKSLKAFVAGHPDGNIQLSDEVRQVFDRMLASDVQIAEAERVAGLLPDDEATAEAMEKLTARSLRDLKWTVNARSRAIKALQKQAAELRKGVEEEVTAEVEAQPVYAARKFLRTDTKLSIAALEEAYTGEGDRYALLDWKPLVQQKLAGRDGAHPDIVADMFGFKTGDELVQALLTAEPIADVIAGMTDQRMLEQHGDLVDQRSIEQAANEAVHNEARARSLATELKSQAEAINARTDTGQLNAAGNKITVNALLEAAKQFAANVVASTPLRDLKSKAAQHTAAERRAGKRWQEHTAKGETADAIKAKQDQMLNNAAAKAALEAQAEMRKILEFFKRVYKDGNEKIVEKGRDPDVVNAARAVLGAYGAAPRASKNAIEYLALVEKNDPAMYAALQPSVQGALNMAQPLESLTMEELRGLHEEIQAMWHLAKRSRMMEVDGNLIDMQEAEDELQARMQAIGVPDAIPGESSAITPSEKAKRTLQFAGSLLRRTEQWAAGMGKEFTRLVFQPIKQAADTYRAERVKYRKAYQALIDTVAPSLKKGLIEAPELRYTFGKGHNGIGHAELLHAVLHTGNESNKRKLLLGRGWATENADGTMDTSKWDAFVKRMQDTGLLTKAHYDFAQGVWDLLEQTKPAAQKTHRDVFGRYFAEVTADSFDTPFGSYRGGYVPAQADPRIVQDAALRDLATTENENMAFSFPGTNKGFTKGRVEYNRPLMLDLRTIGQHIDKVLLFTHMEPAVRDVNKLLSRKGVSYSLGRIDPTIYAGMLTPWLNRSARQIVETPIVGDGGIYRVLSAARSRAGMALMFGNISNTLQQTTGFLTAMSKLKADGLQSQLTRSTAMFIAGPRKMARSVAAASPFMAARMENEISAINGAMDEILLDPSLYEKSQAWALKHSYFLQSAMANTMEPIIWTAGYNAALAKNLDDAEAVKYADALIRQTQGSTLPEDVSRIETGPAYARVFTQFVGYFNMMANTNATALKQIAQEQGLRKGAGKALGIVTLGMLAPLWMAEAIAIAMRGGPEDKDDDGYLDDWLAAVFGMGTIKGTLAMVPFIGQLANAAINRFNSNPADDKMSLSPAVSLLESAVGVPLDVYNAIADPDKLNARNAVRDVASAVSIVTGLPAIAFARPIGYLVGMEDDKISPTGPGDLARGLLTGTPSPESKQ